MIRKTTFELIMMRYLLFVFLASVSSFCRAMEIKPVEIQWVFNLDGYNTTDPADLLVDDEGNSYVGVNYSDRISIPELKLNVPASRHVGRLLVKLNPDGNPVWALPFQSAFDGRIEQMCFAENGDILISGFCDDVSVYPSTNLSQGILELGEMKPKEQFHRNFYVFLARYTRSGERVWVKQYKSAWAQSGGLACNSRGEIYWSVYFSKELSGDSFKEVFEAKSSSEHKSGIFKLDRKGEPIEQLPINYQSANTVPIQINVDREDNVIISGSFKGLIHFSNSDSLSNDGYIDGQDAFVVKFDSEHRFLWARTLSGKSSQHIRDLVIDAKGKIWLTGSYDLECVISSGVKLNQQSGYEWKSGSNFFYASFFPDGVLDFVRFHTMPGYNQSVFGTSLILAENEYVFLAGSFTDTLQFNPTSQQVVTSNHPGSNFLSLWHRDTVKSVQADFKSTNSWAFISKIGYGGGRLVVLGNYYGDAVLTTHQGKSFKFTNRDYGRNTFISSTLLPIEKDKEKTDSIPEHKNHLSEIEEILACLSPESRADKFTWFSTPNADTTALLPATDEKYPCSVQLKSASAVLYPNPTKTDFKLNLSGFRGELTISIISEKGELILRHQTRLEEEELQLAFDVSHLSPGTYFVNVVQHGFGKSFRLIKI